MRIYQVESSNIDKVGYEPANRQLMVQFKNGTVYAYIEVPAEVAANLIFGDSVGSFFNKNVRDRYTTWKAVTPVLPQVG